MKIGIVGLPNVGKSTLFNALTKSKQANVANYPFCTIEPNVGVVEVPDARLEELARVSKSQKIIPAIVEFVDIAGLVKGASKGEGLGNQFLSYIREVDAIVEVVRAFEDPDVVHVVGSIDPTSDAEIINIELALADFANVKKAVQRAEKDAKPMPAKEAERPGAPLWRAGVLKRAAEELQKGGRLYNLTLSHEERAVINELNLLTAKPILYVLNVNEYTSESVKDAAQEFLGAPCISICARLEAELADLAQEEGAQYLKSLGVEESGLDRLIRASYKLLGLITFFTSGEKETRAWTVKSGAKAPEAAGVIHTDFEKAFIRAEVSDTKDFVELGGWVGVKEKGKMRIEGKDYLVRDGDVCYFRVGA